MKQKKKILLVFTIIISLIVNIIPTNAFILYYPISSIYDSYKDKSFDKMNIEQIGGVNGELYSYSDLSLSNKENWPRFYKNFIFDIGLVRFTFYTQDGEPLKEIYVYPESVLWVNDIIGPNNDPDNPEPKRDISFPPLRHPMIKGEKSLILSSDAINMPATGLSLAVSDNIPYFGDFSIFYQNISSLDLGDSSNTGKSIDKQGYNINQEDVITQQLDGNNTIYNLIPKGAWESVKNFNDWNTEENLKKLDEEIDFGLFNSENGERIGVMDWLSLPAKDGVTNSIKVEPIVLYPNSTEEIYCSNLDIAREFILNYDFLKEKTEDALKQLGEFGIAESFLSLFNNYSYDVYCHIGIKKEDGSGNDYYDRQLVPLSYHETETHLIHWQKTTGDNTNEVPYRKSVIDESIYNHIFRLYSRCYDQNDDSEELPLSEEEFDNQVKSFFRFTKDEYEKFVREHIIGKNIEQEEKTLFLTLGFIDFGEREDRIPYEKFIDYYDNNLDGMSIYIALKEYVDAINGINADKGINVNGVWYNYETLPETLTDDRVIELFGEDLKDYITYVDARDRTEYFNTDNRRIREEDRQAVNDYMKTKGYTHKDGKYQKDKNLFDMAIDSLGQIGASITGIYGLGGDCIIQTDHKAASCVIVLDSNKTSEATLKKLAEKGYLKNETYNIEFDPWNILRNSGNLGGRTADIKDYVYDKLSKELFSWGAAIITIDGLNATPITKSTLSNILFKFHSNLEQLGGTGDMDDQYNLFGTIDPNTGETIYVNISSQKVETIPKTYPDSVASSYKKEDGSDYSYKGKTICQTMLLYDLIYLVDFTT